MTNLYLKYRPQTLKEVFGNEDTISTIEEMLSDIDSCPHTFLLHGPTGCGKTTIARIIAKELGCVGSDYHELDSAHFRGIDTVREIRKQAMYFPTEGPVTVWIVDEVHKMTNDAQNALLKILEDTPSHVYFVLATTDPQKLIKTVRGRCIEFKVETLSDNQMKRLLRKIIHKESEKIDLDVIDQIIQDSLGHPRNALQILDQVLRVPPEKQLAMAARSAEEQSQSIELCRSLIDRSPWSKIRNILTNLKEEDAEGIRRHVLAYAQAVLLKSDNERAGLVLEEFMEPFWNSGFPALVYASYVVAKN